ncbi:MAG: T9SS type B sorting domain-containing protein [Ginsengibacter sp.]
MKLQVNLFFIFLFFYINVYPQANSNNCNDSAFRIQYISDLDFLRIQSFKQDINGDYLFCGDVSTNSSPLPFINMAFGKIKPSGVVSWAKYGGNNQLLGNLNIADFTGKNETYWAGISFSETPNRPFICKTDSYGNIISSFFYKINLPGELQLPTFEIKRIKYVNDNEIYLLIFGSLGDQASLFNIVMRLRSDGSVVWSKKFETGDFLTTILGKCTDIVEQGNVLNIAGSFSSFSESNASGMFIMQLNSRDGSSLAMKSVNIPLLQQFSTGLFSTNFKLKETNRGYSASIATNTGAFLTTDTSRYRAVKINMDSNFNVKKVIQILPSTFSFKNSIFDITINKNNETCIVINDSDYYYYSFLNANDENIKTRKFKYASRSNPGDSHEKLIFDSSGVAHYLENYDVYESNKYELLHFSRDWNNSTEDCMGIDTQFVNVEPVTYSPYNFSWVSAENNTADVQSILLSTKNFSLQNDLVCKEISKCDSIKIKGEQRVCTGNDVFTFTAYKNPLCYKNITWQIDSSIVEVISKSNDTTISVKFKKSGSAYVYASIPSCALRDSLKVVVASPQQSFSISKDSLLCPGKFINLVAPPGFEKYNWNAASSSNNFIVTQPGFYKVTATDSCGNIFKDSINVKEVDISFNVFPFLSICRTDTAIMQIPSGISNILWQPSYGISEINNQLLFYPSQSTVYDIEAKKFPGCDVKSTITVQTKKCDFSIFVPNSFTPNNDGLNDFFKPVITGLVEQYEFIVYNVYGQVVFKSYRINRGWDGTFKGILQMPEVFVWICKYKVKNEALKVIKGSVILIR